MARKKDLDIFLISGSPGSLDRLVIEPLCEHCRRLLDQQKLPVYFAKDKATRRDVLNETGSFILIADLVLDEVVLSSLTPLLESGFNLQLLYLGFMDYKIAQARARLIGLSNNGVSPGDIARLHEDGLVSFFKTYRVLAKQWRFYDFSEESPVLLANGSRDVDLFRNQEKRWHALTSKYLIGG